MQTALNMSRSRRGWNLIELMVVISIITILLAILINVAVESSGPKEQTKVVLRISMGAATEYEVTTNQKIDHFNSPPGYTGPNTSIAKLCYQLWKLDRTRNALRSLPKDALSGDANATPPVAIFDAWGRPLRYYSGEGDQVLDESGGAVNLPAAGMYRMKQPYLASAGPDGKWGTVSDQGVRNADAQDNIYSFELN